MTVNTTKFNNTNIIQDEVFGLWSLLSRYSRGESDHEKGP